MLLVMTFAGGFNHNYIDLTRVRNAQSRSLSPENPTGEKGGGAKARPVGENHPARELGVGWKCRPSITIESGKTVEIASIAGSGIIQQIWMTPTGVWRHLILRFYWDGQEHPSVECPIGDFFACGWGNRENFAQINSLAVCVNPGSAFNCYWPMPFQKGCRITVENVGAERSVFFYQINYSVQDVPPDCVYFHAHFRRVNPLPYGDVYTILEGVKGRGHYVGTYMAWGLNNNGWWGEGEIKFYLDGDDQFPTICGTGTEDYFCGSYNFENLTNRQYQEYNTAYAGVPQIIRPDGLYRSQMRFSMYRWHLPDPVCFSEEIKVTMQALGWRSGNRFLPLQDDIASVAYWYQTLPAERLPALPGRDELEII
jgi:hypothetical protein